MSDAPAGRKMRTEHRKTVVKLSVFLIVSAVFAFYLVVVSGNVRLKSTNDYHAMLANASGLKSGSEVRVAGVEVGKVDDASVLANNEVKVSFNADTDIRLTTTTTAVVRYKNLIGDRFLELDAGSALGTPMPDGGTIPVSQTSGALDLDTLLNGFKPLFVGLTPKQINGLAGELVQVLQGKSGSIYELLATVAGFTNTIANRDSLVGDVIENLNTVLGTIAQRDDTLGQLIDQLQTLVSGLAGDAPVITGAITHIDTFAATASSLLAKTETNLTPNLKALQTLATTINRNTDSIQRYLSAFPEDYKTILRTGSFGNFFNFFLCGIKLNLTGSNGALPSIPITTSDAARCH